MPLLSPLQTLSFLSRKLIISFFVSCCYVHICLYECIHVIYKYSLLSQYVPCVCVFRVEHLVLGIQLVYTLVVFTTLCRVKALWAQGSVRVIIWNGYKSQRNREFPVRFCLLGMSEVKPMNSQPHGCVSMNWTRKTPIYIPRWSEKHIMLDSIVKCVIISVAFSFVTCFSLKKIKHTNDWKYFGLYQTTNTLQSKLGNNHAYLLQQRAQL